MRPWFRACKLVHQPALMFRIAAYIAVIYIFMCCTTFVRISTGEFLEYASLNIIDAYLASVYSSSRCVVEYANVTVLQQLCNGFCLLCHSKYSNYLTTAKPLNSKSFWLVTFRIMADKEARNIIILIGATSSWLVRSNDLHTRFQRNSFYILQTFCAFSFVCSMPRALMAN